MPTFETTEPTAVTVDVLCGAVTVIASDCRVVVPCQPKRQQGTKSSESQPVSGPVAVSNSACAAPGR